MGVVQIVPHAPRIPDGVGAFAQALADAGLAAALLPVAGLGPDALAGALGDRGVEARLLHYVNYGYERRGCPHRLVEAIESAPGRLVTIFHEVCASGPPWRSSFWLSPWQRRLAARLARRSRVAVTSIAAYRDLLRRLAPGAAIEILPVASTVGEPGAPPAFAGRPRRLAVFGGGGGRERIYGALGGALADVCRRLAIEEVLDIGPPTPGVPESLGAAPVRGLGVLPADAVSEALLGCQVGACFHPPALLGKSTVYAAYCAHGVAPLVLSPVPEAPDLAAGVHYWRPGLPLDGLAGVAAAANEWYRGHALAIQAARYAELLAP